MAEIRISRRRGGRMQVTQGSSFILFSRDEIVSLIREAQQILDTPDDGPARADTAMMTLDQAQRPR